MLNHKVKVFTVTNMYIRQDFSRINDANSRLINYVFEYHLMSNSRLKELGGTEGDFLTSVHEDTVTFRYDVDPLLKHEDGKLGICFNVAFRGHFVILRIGKKTDGQGEAEISKKETAENLRNMKKNVHAGGFSS